MKLKEVREHVQIKSRANGMYLATFTNDTTHVSLSGSTPKIAYSNVLRTLRDMQVLKR